LKRLPDLHRAGPKRNLMHFTIWTIISQNLRAKITTGFASQASAEIFYLPISDLWREQSRWLPRRYRLAYRTVLSGPAV